ncbi:ABC transporter ATP-binding protein/permease [Nonomuraea longicatena]|uniref:ABC transporter ATP-binding protein/permease n=1 Tax=Nonomuraea longicatena TaxID=83682 RepID=UPI0031D597E3
MDKIRLRYLAGLLLLCWRAGPALTAGQLVTTVVGGLLPMGTVWATKLLIDALTAGRTEHVLGPATALVGLGVAVGALPHLVSYLRSECDRRLDLMLQDRLYTQVNRFQGLSRFENPVFLDELRMAAQATGGSMGPVTSGLFDLGRNVITVIGLLSALAALSLPLAALVAVAAVPVLLARLSLEKRRIEMITRQSTTARREIFYASLITDVDAAKEVRLFGLGDFLKGRVLGELRTQQSGERRLDRREALVQAALAALSAGVGGAGLLWAAYSALSGSLTVGDVTAMVAAVAGTQAALIATVEYAAYAGHALMLFAHHERVMALTDDLSPPKEGAALPALRRGIELRDVWFRYDDGHPWMLRGVDLTIPHGTSLALVGLNGAGKSTLIKLLCRFYDPSRGAILWDGVDIRDVPPAELRARMGVLFQDFMNST